MTEIGVFTSKVSHSHADKVVLAVDGPSLHTGVSIGPLECLHTISQASFRKNDLREQNENPIILYDLAEEVTSAIFYWSHTPTVIKCGRIQHKGMNTRRQRL